MKDGPLSVNQVLGNNEQQTEKSQGTTLHKEGVYSGSYPTKQAHARPRTNMPARARYRMVHLRVLFFFLELFPTAPSLWARTIDHMSGSHSERKLR